MTSLTVVFRQTALRNLTRIRNEDKDLFVHSRRVITSLAEQPRPTNSVEAATVYIINIGVIGR